MKILFIDTMHPLLINSLRKTGHECIEGYHLSYEEIYKIIGEFEGVVIRSRIILDEKILSVSGKLKFIARAGAGMESIDTAYAKKKDIICLNSPEGNSDAVGEHALGMLLSLMNNLNVADRQVRNGEWIRESNRGHELNGKTVGLIGYGNMGSAFAKKLSGMGCWVLAYDKYKTGFGSEIVKEVTMEEIFSETDVLSLHIPLTAETEYLVNEKYISSFRKNIYLINTARGKCVRISDLVKNLINLKVTGACLDVIEYEESSFEKFSVSDLAKNNTDWKYLINSERVMLSPHIAGWTYESLDRIATVLLDKINQVLNSVQKEKN
jgi:D-3-phosphoglycerate dehydrogenase